VEVEVPPVLMVAEVEVETIARNQGGGGSEEEYSSSNSSKEDYCNNGYSCMGGRRGVF